VETLIAVAAIYLIFRCILRVQQTIWLLLIFGSAQGFVG